jgi:hypothetical protein
MVACTASPKGEVPEQRKPVIRNDSNNNRNNFTKSRLVTTKDTRSAFTYFLSFVYVVVEKGKTLRTVRFGYRVNCSVLLSRN